MREFVCCAIGGIVDSCIFNLEMSLNLYLIILSSQPNHLIYRVPESKAPDFSCSQVLIAIDRHAKDYASIHSFLHTYLISQLFQSIFWMQQTAAIKYD